MKTITTLISVFAILVITPHAFAQDKVIDGDSTETNAISKSSPVFRNIYGELFGASNLIGVTYDSRFKAGSKWGYRAGLAYAVAIHPSQMLFYHGSDHAISVPLAINGIFGKGNNYFEAGLGFSPGITVSIRDNIIYGTLPDGSEYIRKDGTYTHSDFYGDIFMDLGYRYQRPSGFMFRAGISPAVNMVGSWSSFLLRPYLSFGYTFK